jgi:Zn-finger nucleic acid-binding protein
MICPGCKNNNLTRVDYKGIQLDYCPSCFGIWFDRNELRQVKDKEDEFIRFVDIDPWKDEKKFKVNPSARTCPVCQVPLYTVEYDGLDVDIDLCNICHGIWLDKGESDKIIEFLKDKVKKETLLGYLKDIGEEFVEIFTGPKKVSSEIADFLIVMKLFEYRLLAKMPAISHLIAHLPG